jgi:hypothetical protein
MFLCLVPRGFLQGEQFRKRELTVSPSTAQIHAGAKPCNVTDLEQTRICGGPKSDIPSCEDYTRVFDMKNQAPNF